MKIYDITTESKPSYWIGSPGSAEYPEGMIKAGPPYPEEEKPIVKQMQQGLEDLGYNIGSTGVDGKFGPRTTRAVDAFKKDYNIPGSPMQFGNAGFDKLEDILSGRITQLEPEKQTKIDTTSDGGGELGPMKLDGPASITAGKVGALLDLIAKPESGGRYDKVYPGRRRPEILYMTLDELYDDMKARAKVSGSSASGRYQYIRKTLQGVTKSMGLNPKKTIFDPKTQDKIAIYHLRMSHGLESWLSGNYSNERFLNRLSRTWAGLPKDSSGRSFYAGDRLKNRAGISFPFSIAQLKDIRGTVA
jgi:peptidoglycan hydrolase-like protein with peptidoglycan-binding domain